MHKSREVKTFPGIKPIYRNKIHFIKTTTICTKKYQYLMPGIRFFFNAIPRITNQVLYLPTAIRYRNTLN